jgi:hypothetical protein
MYSKTAELRVDVPYDGGRTGQVCADQKLVPAG